MSVRMWSLLVWALVGASAVFWALKLGARGQALPAQTTLAAAPELLQADLSRLAGGEAVAAQAAAVAVPQVADGRLMLMGVVSPPPTLPRQFPGAGQAPDAEAQEGLALISVNGKPPRAYAVGALVDGEWVLQSVSPRVAQIGPVGQPPQLTLKLVAPPEPARSSLPAAAAPGGPGPASATQAPAAQQP